MSDSWITRGQYEERISQLESLIHESKREHYHCDDSWYCCGQCVHADHFLDKGEVLGKHDCRPTECNCGADAWNARVDALLSKE
jgi:hypothetical protein